MKNNPLIRSTSTSETLLRLELEKLSSENKRLKRKIEQLTKENMEMKQSLFEFNANRHLLADRINLRIPFDIKQHSKMLDAQLSKQKTLKSIDDEMDSDKLSSNKLSNKLFYYTFEFLGHKGAVYSVQFSQCGRFVASCSFDKTVIVWKMTEQEQLCKFEDHQMSVLDINWSSDSSNLVSGGIDHCVKLWDVQQGKLLHSFNAKGFVQTVKCEPGKNNLLFSGDTKKNIFVFDKRQPKHVIQIVNDAMVNSIYVHQLRSFVLSGDHHGQLKTWDIRNQQKPLTIDTFLINEKPKVPISHLAIATPPGKPNDGDEGKYLAVNCYDNVLRVYDRGSLVNNGKPHYTLQHQLKQHRNRNWPIKSSFYCGQQYDLKQVKKNVPEESRTKSIHDSLLLATGSSDNIIYIYDVSQQEKGESAVLQQLDGHSDIVYGVDFHPTDPILASCSGDSKIKFWIARTES